MVAPEYGSSPKVAGTPAPGSASMSSLGLRPSLDCRLRHGRSAPSARWWTRRGKERPTRHRPGDRRQRLGPARRWCRRGRGRGGPGPVGSEVWKDGPHRAALASSPKCPRLLFDVAPHRPVLSMSQRTKSHPDASCAAGSTNHLTEGSEKTRAVNAQPRGFITSTMRPTMRPTMSAGRRSEVRPTTSILRAPVSASSQPRGLIISIMSPMTRVGEGSQSLLTSWPNRAPDSASSQPRGFTTSVPGEHLWPNGPSTLCRPSSSVRAIPRCSLFCHMPAGAVDRPAKGSTLVFVVVDCDIRPGHGGNEPTGSPARASSDGPAVAPSRRYDPERSRRTASPEGSRSNAPSLQLHSFTGWWKSGSKMVKQVPCLSRRCRQPRSGPVPEVSSCSLRWAS
jgi:hypothetical protein